MIGGMGLRTICFFLLLAGLLREGWSAVPAVEVSIEAKVLTADVVVRGWVVKVDVVPAPGAAVSHGRVWRKLTVVVFETLRGTAGAQIVVLSYDYPAVVLTGAAWPEALEEQLFFLRSGRRELKWDPAWQAGAFSMSEQPLILKPVISEVVAGQDFRMLRTREEVLRVAREAAGEGGTPPLIWLQIPQDAQPAFGYTGTCEVPLTEGMFRLARRWAYEGGAEYRWCAALVLSQENSAENVAALRRLAAWPAPYRPVSGTEMMRLVAQSALYRWGLEEAPRGLWPTTPRVDVWFWRVVWMALLMVGPAVYLWRRRKSGFRWRGLLKVAAVGLLLVLLARSFGPEDALAMGEYDLAMREGSLYLVHHSRPDVVLDGRWVWCRGRELPLFYQEWARWELDFGRMERPLGWFFTAEWRRWEQDPVWLKVWAMRAPVWMVLVVWAGWRGGRWLWRLWGAWRERRRGRVRGFPVEVGG
jgi:hypothetical protein